MKTRLDKDVEENKNANADEIYKLNAVQTKSEK